VAWLLAWSSLPPEKARRWVNIAGAAWVAACVAIWWQTAHGRAVTEFSGAGTATLILFGVWTLAALRGIVAWRTAAPASAESIA